MWIIWQFEGKHTNGWSQIWEISLRKRLAELTVPQSIFYSQLGTATLKNRQRTRDDEFLVIQYFGSTPGNYPNSGNNWVPGGYVNFVIDTTTYFANPDDLPGPGLSGTSQPFPINTSYSPAFVGSWNLEIPPDTNWDITYFRIKRVS